MSRSKKSFFSMDNVVKAIFIYFSSHPVRYKTSKYDDYVSTMKMYREKERLTAKVLVCKSFTAFTTLEITDFFSL